MKNTIRPIIFTVLFLFLSSYLYGETKAISDFKYSIGIGVPNIGLWIEKDNSGHLKTVRGFNLALGYGEKHYFRGAEFNRFNPFWQWGTIGILVPYIGIGGDYIWPSGFYLTIGTLYVAPYIGFGFYY